MTYIAMFNRKYRRQFEALVKDKTWQRMKREYGTVQAAALVISKCHKVYSRRKATPQREKSTRNFVMGSLTRPDIYGAVQFKIGKSKKAILDKGHSELIVWGVRRARRKKRTRRRVLR